MPRKRCCCLTKEGGVGTDVWRSVAAYLDAGERLRSLSLVSVAFVRLSGELKRSVVLTGSQLVRDSTVLLKRVPATIARFPSLDVLEISLRETLRSLPAATRAQTFETLCTFKCVTNLSAPRPPPSLERDGAHDVGHSDRAVLHLPREQARTIADE